MSWHWKPEGPQVESLGQTFANQGDAETWLGEFYPDLRSAGVRAVSLYEEDRKVYGPMSLDPDPSA